MKLKDHEKLIYIYLTYHSEYQKPSKIWADGISISRNLLGFLRATSWKQEIKLGIHIPYQNNMRIKPRMIQGRSLNVY